MPTRRVVGIALGLALLAPLAAIRLEVAAVVILADVVLVMLTVADGVLAVPPERIRVVRRHLPVTSQLSRLQVQLVIDNPTTRAARLEVRDVPAPQLSAEGCEATMSLVPKSQARLTYEARARKRGEGSFDAVFIVSVGPWGLFRRIQRRVLPSTVRVLPALSPESQGGISGRKVLGRMAGLRRARFRGVGREFEALRSYVTGDPLRHVDWKVTARRGHLVTREFSPERDQTIVIMIDTGRMMGIASGEKSRLDHALTAAMALAQAAVQAGDNVALTLFSHDVHAYLGPGKGPAWLRRASDLTYGIQADGTEPDYVRAYGLVRRRISRRALIVTFTDIADAEQSRSLVRCNLSLRPRFLPLLVTFQDLELRDVAVRAPTSRRDLYVKVAAAEYLHEVHRTLRALEGRGALTLEVPAATMTASVLERYFALKFGGRL